MSAEIIVLADYRVARVEMAEEIFKQICSDFSDELEELIEGFDDDVTNI